MYLKRGAAALLVALTSITVVGLAGVSAPASRRAPLGAYRGLGTWVDLYDRHELNHAWKTADRAASHGVRTIFLETSNYRMEEPIMSPRGVSHLIHAAHAAGMKVVAWYLPGFDHLKKDYRRTMKAIRFETTKGQHFDGFAMDIEATVVKSIPRRQRRMLRLSRHVRSTVGRDYPLGAIIPSPSDMAVGSYWGKDFPFRRVADIYDVIVPMSYSSYRAEGLRETHDYIERSINIIRQGSGRKVPIHVIGGVSGGATGREVRGFVRSVRENGILGGSYYDFGTTGPEDWAELEKIPANPLQSPVQPVGVGYTGPLGNIPGKDATHPKEVFFRAPPRKGKATIAFEPFDAQPREIKVRVNWHVVGAVTKTLHGKWGPLQTVVLPNRYVRSDRVNFISFETRGSYPDWSTWGVRNVAVTYPSP